MYKRQDFANDIKRKLSTADIKDTINKCHKATVEKLDNLQTGMDMLIAAARGDLSGFADDSTIAERKVQLRSAKANLISASERLRKDERDQKIAAASVKAADKKKRDEAKAAEERPL